MWRCLKAPSPAYTPTKRVSPEPWSITVGLALACAVDNGSDKGTWRGRGTGIGLAWAWAWVGAFRVLGSAGVGILGLWFGFRVGSVFAFLLICVRVCVACWKPAGFLMAKRCRSVGRQISGAAQG